MCSSATLSVPNATLIDGKWVSSGNSGGYSGSVVSLQLDVSGVSASSAKVTFVPQEDQVTSDLSPASSTKLSGSETLSQTGTFGLTYTINGETCTPDLKIAVSCDTGNGFVEIGGACQCPSGTANISGKCETVQNACSQTELNFALMNNNILGSTGQLDSSLVLPSGATATVTAVPTDSLVSVGTSFSGQWSGISQLPSTGSWDIAVTVTSGSETCTIPPRQVEVVCMAGFVRDATTKTCSCPSGKSNVNGVCTAVQGVCDLAEASF